MGHRARELMGRAMLLMMRPMHVGDHALLVIALVGGRDRSFQFETIISK